MNRNEILTTIETIFKEVFEDETIAIDEDTTADDIEEWDSFNHINLVIAIEKKFDIKFALGELEDLKNVGEFLNLIQAKM